MHVIFGLLLAFAIKHFLCDFVYQTPYMYLNKGNLRHPGGYVHASVHAIATLICFAYVTPKLIFGTAVVIALCELIVHYVVDFLKVNLGKRFNLKPDNSEWFWILLGLDQLLHSLTYIAIIYYVVTYARFAPL